MAVDLGNTTCEFAVIVNNKITKKFFLSSIDFNLQIIHQEISNNIDFSYTVKFIISSVSKHGEALFSYIKDTFQCSTYLLKQGVYKTNIKFLPHQKDAIGMDIICKGAWVVNSLKTDALVLDVGTATVIQYMNTEHELSNVAITLGLNTIYRNINNIATLPNITPKAVDKALGIDTKSAIESGVFWGYIGTINTLLEKAISETSCKNVFITGGLSALILKEIKVSHIYNPDIIFEGINIIYNLNQNIME